MPSLRALALELWSQRPVRYIVTGGILYVIDVSSLLFLSSVLSFSPVLAVACSFWIAFAASFVLQKYLTFGNKKGGKRELGKQTLLYSLLVLFNYAFTIFFVAVFTDILGLVIARTIALLLTVMWNYFVYKQIFK